MRIIWQIRWRTPQFELYPEHHRRYKEDSFSKHKSFTLWMMWDDDIIELLEDIWLSLRNDLRSRLILEGHFYHDIPFPLNK